jgi:hypothetical protein
MRRIVAIVLMTLLVASPALAEQQQGKRISWEKAQRTEAGTEIVLTVTGGQPTKERLLFADDTMLVTLKASSPELPGRVQKGLLIVGSYWPAILDDGLRYKSGHLRLSQDGVFDDNTKLADLTEVIRHTPRSDVLRLSETRHSHLLRNTVIVAALAFIVPTVTWVIVCETAACN